MTTGNEQRGRCLRVATGAGRVLALIGLSMIVPPAGADTTAFRLPATCDSVPASGGPSGGVHEWTNLPRAQSDTDAGGVSGTGLIPEGAQSEYLKCTGFGFTVPTGSTINGLTLQVRRNRGTGSQEVADGHVHPVRSDDAPIGSPGAGNDLRSVVCPAGDWGEVLTTRTYGGAANTWGVTWGACDPSMTLCSNPAGSFNVNHPNFGMALSAEVCTDGANPPAERANVDWMKVQIDYTPPPCAAPFPQTSVVSPNQALNLADARVGVQTNYSFQFQAPTSPTCLLTTSSVVTVRFLPAGANPGPDLTNVSGASVNGVNATNVTHTADTVTFRPSANLPAGGFVAINGVRNPAIAGTYQLEVSATPTASGALTPTQATYEIVDPCIAAEPASAWGPLTVTLADDKQSVAGCPRFTRYTIGSTSPAPSGCALAGGTSRIEVRLPTTAGVDASKVTAAALRVAGAPVPSTFTVTTPNLVTITPGAAVPNGRAVEVTLDVVRNPDAASTTGVVKLKAVVAPPVETGETTSPPVAIAAATATDCAPKLDFYVRDWTTDATTFDTGVEPSTSPNFVWRSDVWNQSFDSTPAVNTEGWVPGDAPWKTETNFAFARISLVPTTAVAYDREVTARFYAALLGAGTNFAPIATVNAETLPLGSNLAANTVVSLAWEPGTFASSTMPNLDHLCLAVEIDSPSDRLVGSITNFQVGSAADTLVVAHNNRAQRNLVLVATPNPLPTPPPPSPSGGGGGGMGGGMAHFAVIHNAATRTRDITMRFDSPADVVRPLLEPRVTVVGGEAVPYVPGGRMTLPAMRPGESRWIALSYGLRAEPERALVPVGFSQVEGEQVVNGFAFGIRPSALPVVASENLRRHAHTFGRLATTTGLADAKREGATAAALMAKGEPDLEAYLRFLREHQPAMGAIVARLVDAKGASDPVGVAASAGELKTAVAGGDASAMAATHLALLERLSTLLTMRQLEQGNPFDIVQMVRWQHDLYATRPVLAALPAAPALVKSSQAFVDGPLTGKGDGARYARLVADSMKAFRAAADAFGKTAPEARAALDRLGRNLRGSTAPLQKAHRDFLLALDDLTAGAGARAKP